MTTPLEPDVPQLLNIGQVAEALAISRSSAYRLASSGELPTVRFHGTVRVLTQDLAAFVQANRHNGSMHSNHLGG